MKLPSQDIMFQYIIHLTEKYEQLEQKILKLERSTYILKKTNINDYLKTLKYPMFSYSEWMSKIEVSEQDLEKLFEYDIKMCIKSILEDVFDSDTPLIAFKEKQNSFYIFDTSWRLMTTDEFSLLVRVISHRILKKYMAWANENRDYLEANPKNQELSMIYMSKANGLNCNTEQTMRDIKKWLFSKICVSNKGIE
jgi:hypothetical protein